MNWSTAALTESCHKFRGGENEEEESAISLDADGNSGDPELVRRDLPEAAVDKETDNQNEFLEGPEVEESAISNLGRCGISETPTYNKMQALQVNKARRT